jgi:hypothetical protein
MLATLNQLVDALTGLERILTTPIPYSCVPEFARVLPDTDSCPQIFSSSLDCDLDLLLLLGILTETLRLPGLFTDVRN